jgi:hypothetical protein
LANIQSKVLLWSGHTHRSLGGLVCLTPFTPLSVESNTGRGPTRVFFIAPTSRQAE